MEHILFLEGKRKKQQRTSRLKIFINFSTRETNVANILTQHGMMEWLSKVFICIYVCVIYANTLLHTLINIYVYVFDHSKNAQC